ncbi:MAG: DUF4190 domain-containing protein [Lachnospiraceae bacterium]|nr:DUF4190 domain-containing protein [Lachnospiraceae bacterium]
MDNNDFFNNDGNNDQNDKDVLDDDIFAEETVEDSDDNENAGQQAVGHDQNDNANNNQQQSQHQNQWNQSRVNPDQWQAYRNGQQSGGENSYNSQYRQNSQYQQNPYQNYGYNGYYQPDNSRGFGIASMVLGIISLLCFCSFLNILPAVLAIIFGAVSLSRRKGNAFAIAGIVCGIISLALLVITVILFARNLDLMNAFQDYMNHYGNGFNYYFGN